jgi:hypothetical protein
MPMHALPRYFNKVIHVQHHAAKQRVMEDKPSDVICFFFQLLNYIAIPSSTYFGQYSASSGSKSESS